jgi:hypothetical protein
MSEENHDKPQLSYPTFRSGFEPPTIQLQIVRCIITSTRSMYFNVDIKKNAVEILLYVSPYSLCFMCEFIPKTNQLRMSLLTLGAFHDYA